MEERKGAWGAADWTVVVLIGESTNGMLLVVAVGVLPSEMTVDGRPISWAEVSTVRELMMAVEKGARSDDLAGS